MNPITYSFLTENNFNETIGDGSGRPRTVPNRSKEEGERWVLLQKETEQCEDVMKMDNKTDKNYRTVNKETYYRKGVYRHFTEDCKCSTSMTARVDVTELVRY